MTDPVSASTPLGTSSDSTGAVLSLMTVISPNGSIARGASQANTRQRIDQDVIFVSVKAARDQGFRIGICSRCAVAPGIVSHACSTRYTGSVSE
jgi:hypothetical protein